MKRISIFSTAMLATCSSLLVASLVGCGGKEPSSSANNQAQATHVATGSADSSEASPEKTRLGSDHVAGSVAAEGSAAADTPQPDVATNLKGVWYGESVFDVDAFNARLEDLDPEQAVRLQQMVSTFSSIVMAAEFRPDSAMELDMMLTTHDGQELRDRSVGTWKVLRTNETGLTIETSEYRNESEEPAQKVYVYQFIDKDHFQFVPDSISADIREFSPRIVFQRVEIPLEEAEVAEGTKKIIR